MIQLGEKSENENDPKPKYASLLKGQTIQTISFEEAMKLFDLPRNVGEYKGEEIVAAIGRFGPYLRYNGKFTSIKKTDNEDPLTMIKTTLVENLYVFTIGMIPPNPSEIIRSEKFKNLINKLRDDFDFIILDTPPYGIITDAAPLINLADGIIAVAKFNQTKSIEFDFTLENLRKIKAPIIGLALTAFDPKKTSGYYYSDYYYQYSYESYKEYDNRKTWYNWQMTI